MVGMSLVSVGIHSPGIQSRYFLHPIFSASLEHQYSYREQQMELKLTTQGKVTMHTLATLNSVLSCVWFFFIKQSNSLQSYLDHQHAWCTHNKHTYTIWHIACTIYVCMYPNTQYTQIIHTHMHAHMHAQMHARTHTHTQNGIQTDTSTNVHLRRKGF